MKITRQQLRKIISEASHLSFEKKKAPISDPLTPPLNFEKESALVRLGKAEELVRLALKEISEELFNKRAPETDDMTKTNQDAAQMKLVTILADVQKKLKEAASIQLYDSTGF